MKTAGVRDRQHIVNILASSFDNNKSVNYLIPQDKRRKQRIRKLMEYSFDICHLYGKVLLSDDQHGCALVSFPDKKRTSIKSMWLDLKLVFSSIGLFNVKKAIEREAKIKECQVKEAMYYLWFIGVDPAFQGKGTGSQLMYEIIADSKADNRILCLETSTLKNLPWYQRFGFAIYNELDMGYTLFFLKRDDRK